MTKPCEVELGHCCFADHWAGCWEKGHEPNDRDERKCPQSAAAVDALYDRVCNRIIGRTKALIRNAAHAAE